MKCMNTNWFVIVNPTSGNGAAKKKWNLIYNELINQQFKFEFEFTKYEKHSLKLLQNAIDKGFTKFICVGGDGTLHNMVNGILSLTSKNTSKIKLGIIPIGTGNDWVKSYGISKNISSAIQTIKNQHTIAQDIGVISLSTTNKKVYFNNLAGIGFDGYVVDKVHKYKHFGFLAYLTGAIVSLASFKRSALKITFNNTILKGKTLMLLIGICKYSGGGMQLTQQPNTTDGLFDISYIKKINLGTILGNLPGLFNGTITNHKLVSNYKTATIKVEVLDTEKTFIQADGELVGSGNFSVSILQNALNFIVPQ